MAVLSLSPHRPPNRRRASASVSLTAATDALMELSMACTSEPGASFSDPEVSTRYSVL